MNLIILYFKSMLGYMIVAFPLYIIGRKLYLKKKMESVNRFQEVLLAVFVIYMIGLASQTIIPKWDMGIASNTGQFYFNVQLSNDIAHLNLIPFHTVSQYFFTTNEYVADWVHVSLINLIGNTILFTPIGFFVPLIWNNWGTFKKIIIVGLGLTFFIEFFQFFIGRSTDIDDVILNTLGVIIGFGMYTVLKFALVQTRNNVKTDS